MTTKRNCFCAIILLANALTGCVGYQFGARSMFPQHVLTVHVPVFDSETFRRGMGEWLTEAVIKEIESRPGYKVVGRARADMILEGRLIGNTKRVLVENPDDQPRDIQVTGRVQVRWVNNRGQVVVPTTEISVPELLNEVQFATSLVPEVGHSNATAQQKVIQQVAKQIVATAEIPW